MIRSLPLLLCFFLVSSNIRAQPKVSAECDSLMANLRELYADSRDGTLGYDVAAIEFRQQVRLADSLKCPKAEGTALVMWGNIERNNGFFDQADRHYQEALGVRLAIDDSCGVMSVYNNLIACRQQAGFPETGLAYAETAEQLVAELGSACNNLPWMVLLNKAHCLRALKDDDDALAAYQTVNDSCYDLQPIAQQSIGDIALDRAEFDKAISYYQKVSAAYREMEDLAALAQLQHSIGVAQLGIGDTITAEQSFVQALGLASEVGIYLLMLDPLESLLGLRSKHLNQLGVSENLLDLHLRGVGSFEEKNNITDSLAARFARNGEFQTAYNLQTRATNFVTEDLIEQKEREMELVTQRENEDAMRKKQQQITGLIIGLLLLTIVTLIVVRQKEKEKTELREEKREQALEHTSALLGMERKLREQLAFETHDLKTVAAAVRNNLDFAVHNLTFDTEMQEMMHNLHEQSSELFQEIRRVNRALEPDQNEWYKHIGIMLKHLEHDGHLETSITSQGLDHEIPPEIGYKLYTILNVLTDNVKEHADAEHLDIGISKDQTSLNINIKDDGVGYFPDPNSAGTGLRSVYKRMAELEGQIVFSAPNGKGTQVDLSIPLKNAE